MSSLLERMVQPPPPDSFGASEARERQFFDGTVTVLREAATAFVAEKGEHDLPLENIPARRYPYSFGSQIPRWEATRPYTDKVLLEGRYPRIHSGHLIQWTDRAGEMLLLDVNDVTDDGDARHTTLLCRRRGIDET